MRVKGEHAEWADYCDLMLFWCSLGVSSAVVERSFSFLTMLAKELRRGRMTVENVIRDVLMRIHKDLIEEKLEALLQE